MLHLIPLTLEQLWVFLSSPVLWWRIPFLCVFLLAPRLCTRGICHVVVVDSCHVFSSKKRRRHVTHACRCYCGTECAVRYCQFRDKLELCGVARGEGIGPLVEYVCESWVCASLCRTERRYAWAQACICSVSVCTRICTCVGLYTPNVHEPDKRTGGWVCLSVEFWSNVMPMYYMPPSLFVLITERFT